MSIGAKQFYESLGWRMDVDLVAGESFRAVQVTPPHSPTSIAFGKGLTTAEPGSAQRLLLAVDDIETARADLVSRGVEVSEVFHLDGGPVPGPDPQRRSYQTYAAFSDPGRQRLAAPGDHGAAARPGMVRQSRFSDGWPRCCSA